MKNGKIEFFTDLRVWKEGHTLVLMIYTLTKLFPAQETYSLVDQMRRAATSVTANISEGFGRHTYKEKVQFYYLSKGSLNELKNFLYIARDVNYMSKTQFEELMNQSNIVEQILQGFIKKSKTFVNRSSLIVNHI